jgi:hypothetical protein
MTSSVPLFRRWRRDVRRSNNPTIGCATDGPRCVATVRDSSEADAKRCKSMHAEPRFHRRLLLVVGLRDGLLRTEDPCVGGTGTIKGSTSDRVVANGSKRLLTSTRRKRGKRHAPHLSASGNWLLHWGEVFEENFDGVVAKW